MPSENIELDYNDFSYLINNLSKEEIGLVTLIATLNENELKLLKKALKERKDNVSNNNIPNEKIKARTLWDTY